MSNPSTLSSCMNSSISSPFLRPRALRRPLETVLLFLLPSSSIFTFGPTSYQSSEPTILFLSLIFYSYCESEEPLLISISQLSLIISPSLPKDFFFVFTSPIYFLMSLDFLSDIDLKLQMFSNLQNLNKKMSTIRDRTQSEGIKSNSRGITYRCVDSDQQKIKKELEGVVSTLEQELQRREHQQKLIRNKLQHYYRYQDERKALEVKEVKLQSQLEDLEQYYEKMRKETKMLEQQQQIKKGRAIVQHNKITEIRQQQETERNRKQVLEKHLQEVKRGTEALGRKIKVLKQDLKKKSLKNVACQQQELKSQINRLACEIQNKQSKLKKIQDKQKKYIASQQYSKLKHQQSELKRNCQQQERVVRQNKKLKLQNLQLQERINFLKNVDSEFIDEKKSFIKELKLKYSLLDIQKKTYEQQFQRYREELSGLENQHKEGLQLSKKFSKRRKEQRVKGDKKKEEIVVADTSFVQYELKLASRWKGKVLRRKCFLGFLLLIMAGLLMGSMTAFRL